ncbi:MAG: inorganic phosphate transporter [Bacteroidales bacterium]|jgi:phosphate/sulfate permease|nr:inorganic phosphate transporter [Bacteroidales bacterium]
MDVYLIFVIVLFFLAASDLVVGITNDAANFLNSAIGSKVASFNVIITVAAVGVLVGATFSSGMMEIARSGIFHPDKFYFSEIMIIFLAVMVTDVILLDTYNTFGLPTSTTVSIVFELLGAAVAISLIKVMGTSEGMAGLNNYINTAKALAIISGILVSVIIAFTCGMIVQFITRLIFSFNYEKYMKYFGSLWGGLAVTAIVYFMIVKGAKGASFMTEEALLWLKTNTMQILLVVFAVLVVLFQILISLFRINILRIIVLVGTFSLAMAFAGNDLVNFIGVPLAGFDSFRLYASDPASLPDNHTMEALLNPVKTPTLFLLAAGTIMVLTLFFSRKARTVSQTEINLARQGTGAERFSSTRISRSVVRGSVGISKLFDAFIPEKVRTFIESRFAPVQVKKKQKNKKDASSFDQLRASVNMFVASILIASATSLKLPLSTTYVTFMVAMGTSLSDGAWGRESAVFRISGVISVIGGWFFTAISAFTVSFLLALFLNWGGMLAIFASLALAIFFVIRTNFIHRRRVDKENKKDEFDETETLSGDKILKKCNSSVTDMAVSVSNIYHSIITYLVKEDRRKLKRVLADVDELNNHAKELKYNIYPTLRKLEEGSVDTGHYYVQTLDYIREIAHSIRFIATPAFEYLNNHHPPLVKEQIKDLTELDSSVSSMYDEIIKVSKSKNFNEISRLLEMQHAVLDLISKMKKRQVKYVKDEIVGTRNTLMYLNLLEESKNLVLYTINMVKAHRDFVISDQARKKIANVSIN